MKLFTIIPLMGLLTVSACANGASTSYQSDLERMEADCLARGGTLSPRTNATYARPQSDYVCQVTGVSSGRIRE